MKTKVNIFNVGITAFCSVLYATQWYNGTEVPAWQALIWCVSVCLHEFANLVRDSE